MAQESIHIKQAEEIEELKERVKSKVSWQVLGVLVTVSIAISGWLISGNLRSEAKADEANKRIGSVEGDIKEIKNDTQWIKQSLQKIEQRK